MTLEDKIEEEGLVWRSVRTSVQRSVYGSVEITRLTSIRRSVWRPVLDSITPTIIRSVRNKVNEYDFK